MDLTKEELLHLIAITGNTSGGNAIYKLYLKLEQYGNEKFGDEFRHQVNDVEILLDDIEAYPYDMVEDKVKKIATR